MAGPRGKSEDRWGMCLLVGGARAVEARHRRMCGFAVRGKAMIGTAPRLHRMRARHRWTHDYTIEEAKRCIIENEAQNDVKEV